MQLTLSNIHTAVISSGALAERPYSHVFGLDYKNRDAVAKSEFRISLKPIQLFYTVTFFSC